MQYTTDQNRNKAAFINKSLRLDHPTQHALFRLIDSISGTTDTAAVSRNAVSCGLKWRFGGPRRAYREAFTPHEIQMRCVPWIASEYQCRPHYNHHPLTTIMPNQVSRKPGDRQVISRGERASDCRRMRGRVVLTLVTASDRLPVGLALDHQRRSR
ncbi:uncharacterized protein LOC143209646 [Lasioglossum baleicum]|uniref:uncharacterized protein LOC143209646 n=1 Tax=Lasioglossum baleicum TaxID=434251 RepID=UPI003FCDF5F4